MIRDGVWRVGDRLPPEKELAEQLGVGRSTIREALQNLMAINVIESSAGQRTVIKSPTPEEIFRTELVSFLIGDRFAAELLEARAMIEPECARLAAMRGTEADFRAVDEILDRHQDALDRGAGTHEPGAEFHLAIARCSGNRVAEMFMHSILELLMTRGRLADGIPGARQREVEDHRRLLAVIRTRDGESARQAMLDHIRDWSDTFDGDNARELVAHRAVSRAAV